MWWAGLLFMGNPFLHVRGFLLLMRAWFSYGGLFLLLRGLFWFPPPPPPPPPPLPTFTKITKDVHVTAMSTTCYNHIILNHSTDSLYFFRQSIIRHGTAQTSTA